MTRNLKALGLALVAMFAMSAMAASAAQAQTQGEFTAAASPATLTGDGGGDKFTAAGTTVTCSDADFHSPLTNVPTTTVTITPIYTGCTVGTLPATVTMNNCDYMFHAGNTAPGGNGTYGVTVDVDCPTSTTTIEIDAWLSPHRKTTMPNNPDCIVTVSEAGNQGLTGAHLTNDHPHVNISGTVTGVDYEVHKNHFLCPGEDTVPKGDGEYDINEVTVEGRTEGGGANTISVSDS